MARRPGPAPKDPSERLRRNADPLLDDSGWTEIENEEYAGDIPPIPSWVDVSEPVIAAYEDIARLPQAQLWGPGSWMALHLALPTVERFLNGSRGKGSSEAFKALISTLGPALRLTDDDMQKARIKFARVQSEEEDDAPTQIPENVARMDDRRKRFG